MKLKVIGYWTGGLSHTELPLPHELVGELSQSVRHAVCEYLTNGQVYQTYRGHSWCRFYCGISNEGMGGRELTDGEWVWPDGLVHYIQEHSVVLPEEFIAFATSGRKPKRKWFKHSVSLDFWIAWARNRRSPDLRKRLDEALAAAEAAKPILIESFVTEILKRESVGTEKCKFAGCSNFALEGRRLCARHTLGDNEIEWRTAHLYQLPKLT
jgi:hypothetical protein